MRRVTCLLGLAFVAAMLTAPSQRASANGQKVESRASGRADQKQDSAGNAVATGNLRDRKKPVQPDCGTPKECRAEQRQKDDLVAQQIAAQAAVDQARSSWWQAGIGAAGVILLVLTVLYSQRATRAAVDAVQTLVGVERARISMLHRKAITTKDGVTATFGLLIRNVGRTTAILKETCVQGSASGRYADFKPTNTKRHNSNIPTGEAGMVHELEFPLGADECRFLVGYYKFTTIFSKRVLTDYFCLEVGNSELPLAAGDAAAKAAVFVESDYRTDLDWPPDDE